MKTTEERYWALVRRGADSECWPWLGATHRKYGQFTLEWWRRDDGEWRCKTVRAHRYVYELLVGPIPKGLTIDHLCGTPECQNPKHMEVTTSGENARRGNLREVCRRNLHALTEDNVIRRPSRPNERECRACAQDRKRSAA